MDYPKFSALSASPTPAEYCCPNLQERRLHPVTTSYCWNAYERKHGKPHGPACMTRIITLPSCSWFTDDSWDEASLCLAPLATQPDCTNNSNTNIFVLQLERQDKQGAKLGANCNTTEFGSQPSFQLLIYFCPNFPPRSPSLQYFWADHNTHRGVTNGCVAKCLPSTN